MWTPDQVTALAHAAAELMAAAFGPASLVGVYLNSRRLDRHGELLTGRSGGGDPGPFVRRT